MLFNSFEFAIFLPLVFALYWLIPNKSVRLQNVLLLVASYVFYGWWDWRFLSLIIISSILDFILGLQIYKTEAIQKRKFLLAVSLIVNLGFLMVFKYYNFFLDNFIEAFRFAGREFNSQRLNIILPVGISFYTFQTLSYTIDIYRKKICPTNDILSFFAFVSFFPQLVAGPIERASNLLPQFHKVRQFNYQKASDGMRQILWGLFKKIVIADTAAPFVNQVFNSYSNYTGTTLFIAAILFSFQIYCDFSGYSDIAIGTARLFGFNLMQNFAFPYFSRNIAEFWRRWHISLSSWFRDYVYIPLGGSKRTKRRTIFNLIVIFTVSGFWHGANWTFIVWGLLNALYFIPLFIVKRNRNYMNVVAQNSQLPNIREFIQILITFFITVIAWVVFRSVSIYDAKMFLFNMLSDLWNINITEIKSIIGYQLITLILFITFMLVMEWLNRFNLHGFANTGVGKLRVLRWSFYLMLATIILYKGNYHNPAEFIYFQF